MAQKGDAVKQGESKVGEMDCGKGCSSRRTAPEHTLHVFDDAGWVVMTGVGKQNAIMEPWDAITLALWLIGVSRDALRRHGPWEAHQDPCPPLPPETPTAAGEPREVE